MIDPLQAAVVAASEAVTLHDLVESALPDLQRAVGASNALVYRYGDGGRMEAVGGSLAGELGGYARDLVGCDPLQDPPRRMEPGLKVVMITRDVDGRTYRRSDAYHLFYRPHDVEHVTCTWLSGGVHYGDPGMTGMLFARAAGEEPFSDREAATLHQALPALAAAVRRSDRVAAALEGQSALEAIAAASVRRPLLAFSAAGVLRWVSPLAAALLGPSGKPPPALAAEARRLGALASGQPAGSGSLPATVRAFALPGGGEVRAELSIARAGSGEPVVLAELSPAGGPGAEPAALGRARALSLEPLGREHGLTRAELDVLGVLAMGLTNREIAARLFVSVETVRTHVSRILRKTGASTRGQAAVLARERMG